MRRVSLSLFSRPEPSPRLSPTSALFVRRLCSLLLGPLSLSPRPVSRFLNLLDKLNREFLRSGYPSQSLYKRGAHTVLSIFCVSSDGVVGLLRRRGSRLPKTDEKKGDQVSGWCARRDKDRYRCIRSNSHGKRRKRRKDASVF